MRPGLFRALIAVLLAAPAALAQDKPAAAPAPGKRAPFQGGTLIRPLGQVFSFKDALDPTRRVIVCLGGVEVEQGARTLKGDTLVIVTIPDAGKPGEPEASAAPPAPGPGEVVPDDAADGAGAAPLVAAFPISDARLAELYLDGHVSVVEGGETITGASSFLLDNTTGVATVVQGELRTATPNGGTLVARYELLHRLRDGSLRMTDVSYTNCDHGNPHWHVRTPEATLSPTPEGRVLDTAANTIVWGDVPVMWWPGLNLNVDDNDLPLNHLSVGHGTRFGYELETGWGGRANHLATGVAGLFGYDGKVRARWDIDVNLYSKRGLFTQPGITYQTKDSKGTLFGSYIHDNASTDHLDQPIEDHDRGRIDLKHRTKIDEHQTVDIEVSKISDANFLQEYYENEFRTGKVQETYVSYRNVVENHEWGVLARTRLNDFDTQVEYMPEITHRFAGEQIGDAFLTMHDFISNAHLAAAEDSGGEHGRDTRVGSDAEFTLPFDLPNGDRFNLTAGQDITGFAHTIDEGSEIRYAADWGAQWSRLWSGTGEAHSETWNIEGVRRIVELRAGYFNRFALTNTPDELIQIDQVEELNRTQAFTLDLRDRIQTHQDGKVATLLDTQAIMPIYPDKDRDNDGDALGPLQLDTRWAPHARLVALSDAVLRWRATFDPNARHYQSSYASFSTSIGEGRRLVLGNSAVAGQFDFVTASVQWLLNPKWTVAVFLEKDTRTNDSIREGLLLRQKAHCWFIDIELSNRRADTVTGDSKDETSFTISFRPVGTGDEDLTSNIENRIF